MIRCKSKRKAEKQPSFPFLKFHRHASYFSMVPTQVFLIRSPILQAQTFASSLSITLI